MLNWVEVDGSALRNNVREFRRRVSPQSLLAAVVKSNAYGHGLIEVSSIALDAGVGWLCVNSLDEAVKLLGQVLSAHLARRPFTAPSMADCVPLV